MNPAYSHRKIRNAVLVFALAILTFPTASRADVIYGIDTRQNYSDLASAEWKKIARSTSAMVYSRRLEKIPGGQYRIRGKNLGQEKKLCADERFVQEPVVADCSGFLVAPSVVVTAGHCLKRKSDCGKISWVFELNDSKIEAVDAVEFDRNLVYSCSSVLKFDPVLDVAVLKLDRKVENRKPLEIRKNGEIKSGARVGILGYSSRLPLKISLGGRVREVSKNQFIAEVNSAYGSSGSAIVSETSHEVQGLLVDGEEDWEYDHARRCFRSKVCADGECTGETIIKIQKALEGVQL